MKLFAFSNLKKNLSKIKYEVKQKDPTNGLFHNKLSMRPWLVYSLVNLVSLACLVALGFWAGLGISSRCEYNLKKLINCLTHAVKDP